MESIQFFFSGAGTLICALSITIILILLITYRGRVLLSFLKKGKTEDEVTIENLQNELKKVQGVSALNARKIEDAARMQRYYTDRAREMEQNRLTLDEIETLLSFCDPVLYKHRVPVDGLMRKLLKLRNGV